MLNLVLGKHWGANRKSIFSSIAKAVKEEKENIVLIVPELISHDMERRLCREAGDTASRFAEVLSFTRLARRVSDVSGRQSVPYLDDGGRVAAMAAAITQVNSRLKFFASAGLKPEFITGLVETIDECKRCSVDPESLMHASKETTGILAQKLEELSLIFGAYDSICARGKKDPRDQLTWLLEELEACDYAQDHIFFIDGFADFTRQQTAVLEHLISSSSEVTISLTCDRPGATELAFERPGKTCRDLLKIAEKNGIAVEVVENNFEPDVIGEIAETLFEGEIKKRDDNILKVVRCDTIYHECEAVAEYIMDLVRNGSRYRDISIVCPQIGEYEAPLSMVFQRCGIPSYLSGTQNILDRPVIATVLCAIEAALSGFERTSMLNYLKTVLSPLELQQSDLVENYVLLWGISGKKWTAVWQMHPRGFADQWSEKDRELLETLNSLREFVMQPLIALRDGLLKVNNAAQQTLALYEFMVSIKLAERLAMLSDRLEQNGDRRDAQILDQLWEILVNALEQMHSLLSDVAVDPETFLRLFRTLLSRYDVGTIPTVLDAVTVGSVDAMRCNETQHLVVLGAVEGALPSYGAVTGVLTEQDRNVLRDLGISLNGGAIDGLQTAFSEIYGVFRSAIRSIWVSCPAEQPSFVYLRLKEMTGVEMVVDLTLGAAVSNSKYVAAYLLQYNDRQAATKLGVEAAFDSFAAKRSHVHGYVAKDRIEKLYGTQFKLSASQIDLHANCAMSYFLKYGLRAKERKPAEVDPAEFGTFVHDVLEKTAKKIVELGGFKVVPKEEALQIAATYAKNYVDHHFSDLDSQRLSYLLKRNGQELALIIEELWNELHYSDFSPTMFELSFGGNDATYPAIQIQGSNGSAKLRGFVDRVDLWKRGEQTFVRVVDYKTGAKSLDYCDLINGIGLQMLLYLFALTQSTKSQDESAVPAGVQYFPARAPIVTVENGSDDAEVEKERESCWKRSGLLLNDDLVLAAMAPEEIASKMPYKRKKDGTLTGDLANVQQFALLQKFILGFLKDMVDDIASGNVAANPYTRDAKKNACRFCPYAQICHKKDVADRRVFRAITAQRFWDDIEKEVEHRG